MSGVTGPQVAVEAGKTYGDSIKGAYHATVAKTKSAAGAVYSKTGAKAAVGHIGENKKTYALGTAGLLFAAVGIVGGLHYFGKIDAVALAKQAGNKAMELGHNAISLFRK